MIDVIDELVADPSVVADGVSLVELHRQLARLDAVTAKATGVFDASKEWSTTGAQNAAQWLASRTRLPLSTLRGRVRVARACRTLPVAEAAWLAGDISGSHVRLLDDARDTDRLAEAMVVDEAALVGEAKRWRFKTFAHDVACWVARTDPDRDDEKFKEQQDRRRFNFSQSFEAMWFADGLFDPISGEIVAGRLRAIEQELFQADWAEAAERLGREPTVFDLGRTAQQRRADALVEMAVRAGTAPVGGRRPEPLFTVLVGYETFAGRVCELASGTPVAAGGLVRWLGSAWIERVVFGGPSRVIDVGVTRRLFDGATRRAVQVRDRECFHPDCDRPSADCEIDHTLPFAAGGETKQANGRPACGFHNRQRNRRGAAEADDRGPP